MEEKNKNIHIQQVKELIAVIGVLDILKIISHILSSEAERLDSLVKDQFHPRKNEQEVNIKW